MVGWQGRLCVLLRWLSTGSRAVAVMRCARPVCIGGALTMQDLAARREKRVSEGKKFENSVLFLLSWAMHPYEALDSLEPHETKWLMDIVKLEDVDFYNQVCRHGGRVRPRGQGQMARMKGVGWVAFGHWTRPCAGQPWRRERGGGGVGGVSRSPDGLFAQQEREPIRGRPAVRGKRAYGGRPGQCVEEQGTWASRTQKHSEAGYGRPVDRGAWTAKTVKRPRQQPAHPQYANYWAPLTRKQHILPHPAQPQHTNHWAPRTRK